MYNAVACSFVGSTSDVSAEASSRLLVEERNVVALGIDTASIDHGSSDDFIVHQIAAANVVGLGNIGNLEEVPPVS